MLWVDAVANAGFSFELKTKKQVSSDLTKADVGQGHNHLQWVSDNHPQLDHLGLVFISPNARVNGTANPSEEMYHSTLPIIRDIGGRILAAVDDLRAAPPGTRAEATKAFCEEQTFTVSSLFEAIARQKLVDLLA